MDDIKLIDMLSALVMELDYDQWKQIFAHECIEDEEYAADTRARLIAIVRRYIDE